jgi:hypothetical protein
MTGRSLGAFGGYGDRTVEHVTVLDLGVVGAPNAPEAVLVSDGFGGTVLALNPHFDDEDQGCVVLVWTGTRSASLAGPNDEAISGHRLYEKGLGDAPWAGQVIDSELVHALERENRVHAHHDSFRFEHLAHHVLRLKERVAEVVAESIAVRRLDGSTLDAAAHAMRP